MLVQDDQEFLSQMAKQLDETIKGLKEDEEQALAKLGEERTCELRMYWNKEFNSVEMEEVRRFIDYDDRRLIWIWSCLQALHTKRALVGKNYMVMSNEFK